MVNEVPKRTVREAMGRKTADSPQEMAMRLKVIEAQKAGQTLMTQLIKEYYEGTGGFEGFVRIFEEQLAKPYYSKMAQGKSK